MCATLNKGGMPKKVFPDSYEFEQQIGISEYLSWNVHGLSEFLSFQAPSQHIYSDE